jgi:hypothetical protein
MMNPFPQEQELKDARARRAAIEEEIAAQAGTSDGRDDDVALAA